MKKILMLFILILASCSTTKEFYSTAENSSQKIDPKYTQNQITEKIPFEKLDQSLSRFYEGPETPHIAAIPITGALIDSIAFSKTAKDDYDRYEYRKIADSYKAFLFNKVSCFYTFIRGSDKQVSLKDYDIFIGNTGEAEHKAVVKNEQEHNSFLVTLNGNFPKTYTPGLSRSIDTASLYTQDLICGDKIDFKKPFYIQFKFKSKDTVENKTVIELYWL